MNHAVAFDTHAYVKKLVSTGFTEEQAETQMRLLSEVLDAQLSTKADLAKVDARVLELTRDIELIRQNTELVRKDIKALDVKIETTRAELKKDIESTRAEFGAKIESTKAELSAKIESTRAELKKDIESTRAELKKDIESTRAELNAKIESTKAELNAKIESTKAELKKDIESTRADLKRDLKELELRMIIKMGAMILAAILSATGVLVTAQRLWPIPIQSVSSVPVAPEIQRSSAP
ncbi:MAG: DUF1640 domain-containing protein [Magnetococcales bacterium]|nr:DUF1640 domain-containing protein [Magnetococcales bacterium]